MRKAPICALIYIALLGGLAHEVYAAQRGQTKQKLPSDDPQSPSQNPASTASDKPSSVPSEPNNILRDPSQDLQRAQADIASLRDRVETITGRMNLLITVLTVLLALGGLTSLWSWFQNERRAVQAHSLAIGGETAAQRRAGDAHAPTIALVNSALQLAKDASQRATEAHLLAVGGERAAQQRAHEVHTQFLQGSVQTLDLVNSTLQLAKDASERAAKSIQRKAQNNLERLDQEATHLVADVPEQDERKIVSDLDMRTRLKTLAHKIMGFEINQLLLPEELVLTPHCIFIRGMYQHLEQQFEEAIESWTAIALSRSTPDDLKSRAWYWIGYENNNIGEFTRAEHSFSKAIETASPARQYELRRILIESRFFNKANDAGKLIQPLEELLEAVANDKSLTESKHRIRILVTLGNVWGQIAAKRLQEDGDADVQSLRDKAISVFQAAGDDKWAMFGLAEMTYDSGKRKEATPLFTKVKDLTQAEATNRDEMRTKVLARTTELICCMRVPELQKHVAQVYGHATAALGQVDGRLTVYSQMEKRNILKEEFRLNLEKLVAEYKTAGGRFD